MAHPRNDRAYTVVSSYPPTPCGIATFTAALTDGLRTSGADVGIVRLGDEPIDAAPHVVASLDQAGRPSSPAAGDALQAADVVIVQHEYGLYPGPDGDSVVGLLQDLDRPSIVVAHTVLREPTAHQRLVLELVAEAADAVVVMTAAGRDRLCDGFAVDPNKVVVIPHGAAVVPDPTGGGGGRPGAVLTWGLLGPGKGIEWAIDALALLDDLTPQPRYLIAGDTHPKVAALDGEAYRDLLVLRAHRAGVASQVRFDAGYRGLDALADLIREASVVVLPYDSPDQVTSGVLVDAVAAGRPVIATAFPHAVELLASGAGLVVPRRDPVALADALRRVLTEPGLAEDMAREARRIAPDLAWPAVAQQYADLGERLLVQDRVLSA